MKYLISKFQKLNKKQLDYLKNRKVGEDNLKKQWIKVELNNKKKGWQINKEKIKNKKSLVNFGK